MSFRLRGSTTCSLAIGTRRGQDEDEGSTGRRAESRKARVFLFFFVKMGGGGRKGRGGWGGYDARFGGGAAG